MKKNLYFILFLFLSLPAFSAVSIKGKVIDANTQSPLDFVNITVFKQGNSIPVASVVSNTTGDFTLPTVNNGKYSLRISYVGYNTHNQELTISEKPLNLGTIPLEGNAKNLAAVEVIGQGSQMRFDIDKKVFSVDKNISAAGGSASDVLKNIPSVKVDNEGNVSLRKDANVEVWINGKPSGLTADNRAQVLQQMPAESIESIEIMTNPSAKFNPEGTAGIINLVMKKNRKAGYYGSVSAGLMYPTGGKIGQSFGTNINYNSGKIDAYLNIGYRAMNFKGGGNSTRYNNATPSLADTILTQNNVMRNSFSGLFVRTGIDYHLNDKNTISIGGFGMAGSGNSNSTLSYLKTDLISNQIIRDYSQTNTGTGTRPSINVNVDYRHDFDSKGNNNLMTSLSYSAHNRGGDNRYQQTDLPSPINDKTQSSDNNNKEFVFKTDYTNKFTETSRFEAGWQSTVSDRLSDASGYYTQTNVSLPEYQDKFDYNEMIHAAYLTYGDRFLDKFSVQGGLRAEYLNKKIINTTATGTQTIDPKPTLQLFPSMYFSYTLSKSDEIQLNYTRRVNRPRGRQISPFRDYSDSTSISYGNPNLLPEYSSSLELNYLKSWQSHSLSASAYYRITNNVIENVRFFNAGTMENTYMNIAKKQNSGLELVAKDQLFTILNLTSSANLYYSKINSSVYMNPYNPTISTTIPGQSTFSWSANLMANLMLSKTMSGQITAEYSSPTLIAQGKESAEYKIDLGLRKTFFNRKLSVNVMAMDIFNFNKDKTTTHGAGFYQIAESYFHRRMIGLSVSYNFGNMKPKQADMKKKVGTGEINMDTSE